MAARTAATAATTECTRIEFNVVPSTRRLHIATAEDATKRIVNIQARVYGAANVFGFAHPDYTFRSEADELRRDPVVVALQERAFGAALDARIVSTSSVPGEVDDAGDASAGKADSGDDAEKKLKELTRALSTKLEREA